MFCLCKGVQCVGLLCLAVVVCVLCFGFEDVFCLRVGRPLICVVLCLSCALLSWCVVCVFV